MELEPAPSDQVTLRIGRAEREAADARLREALREDVLTISEYDERLGLVLAARTQSDLDIVVADLPAPAAQPEAPPVPGCDEVTAMMSREEQRGRWRPGLMGNIEVVVADDALVELTGTAVMGEKKNTASVPAAAGGPHVRIHANVVMGSLEVRNANRRERKGRRGAAGLPAVSRPTPNPRRWAGQIVGVGLLALLALGPGRAALSADAVSLFGSVEVRRGE